jgi:hypothetical protein
MNSRREILRAHYLRLIRKAATWVGVGSILATAFVAVPTQAAAQITNRSTTLANSKAAASTRYTFTFTGATATTMKAIKFEVCTSPLQTTSCSASNSSTIASATFNVGASTGLTSWAISGTQNATQVIISNGTGVAGNGTITAVFDSVTNPNAANTQFYTRITTYTDTAASLPNANGQDYGAMAVSTGTEITVAANVQESIQFSVGASGTCGSITGSSVNIGNNPGTDNVLQIGTASAGTSVMCVNTNATSGYVISYVSNSTHNNAFTNGTYDITDSSGGSTFASAVSCGTDLFGLNVRANNGGSSGPTAGADPSGGVAPTSYGAAYGTANTYGYVRGTQTTLVSETTGPTANTLYTVTYAAVAGTATKTGAYQVKMNYVATGTF